MDQNKDEKDKVSDLQNYFQKFDVILMSSKPKLLTHYKLYQYCYKNRI
jgi:hypothetical protein